MILLFLVAAIFSVEAQTAEIFPPDSKRVSVEAGEVGASEIASCTSSSQCFSHEHCDNHGTCVDSSVNPCSSSGDCVAGESCDLQQSPHKCR